MAFPKFDEAKHPRGFHGRFGHGTGAAAIFGMGASKARLHLATKKPMAPLPPELRGIKAPGTATKATSARAVMTGRSGGAAAVMAGGGSKTPQQHIEALRGRQGSAAADYAAGIKGKELDAVLQHAGLSRTGTVAVKRERLIGHAHGAAAPARPHAKAAPAGRVRQDLEVIRRASESVSPFGSLTGGGASRAAAPAKSATASAHVAALEGHKRELAAGDLTAAHAARAHVAKVKGAELNALLRHYGLSTDGTVAQKRTTLVRHVVGADSGFGTAMPAKSAAAVMAKPGSARAVFAAGSAKRLPNTTTPAESVRRLKTMGSTEEAQRYLAKATKADLQAIAGEAGVHHTKSATKSQLLNALVQHTVGRRLDSAAISRPAPSAHMSDKPLLPNKWGDLSRPGDIHFHDDGAIGTAIKSMGQDRHLEVEGDALANVLGHIATDAVAGRITAQQQVERLKQVRKQLPPTSRAHRELSQAISHLDVPESSAPKVPEGTLAPLRQLMADLHAVPLVRHEPDREQAALTRIVNDFAAGKTGGGQLLQDVRRLTGMHHESQEGYFEIRRAVLKALAGLEEMRKASPKSLYPPGF